MVYLVVFLMIAILVTTFIVTSKYHQPLAGLILGLVLIFYGSWLFLEKAKLTLKITDNIWDIESINLSRFWGPFLTVILGIGCIVISIIMFSLQKISNLERDELKKTAENEDKSDC